LDKDTSYLSGNKLYGDDFDPKEIAEWFEDEKKGMPVLALKPERPIPIVTMS